MKQEQQMMVSFMEAAGQACPDQPEMPTEEVQKLRLKLHEEEAVVELREAFESGDLTLVADAIGDALYVVLGTAVACGIDIQPVFDEIHRSNMSKFIDGHRRDDGKWVKGPSYTPADLGPIIEEQMR